MKEKTLVMIATDARNTNENRYFLETCTELKIPCIIFHLDEISIFSQGIQGFEINFHKDFPFTDRANDSFKNLIQDMEFWDKDRKSLIFQEDFIKDNKIFIFTRRMGKSIGIKSKTSSLEPISLYENNLENELYYIQNFLIKLSKLRYLENLGIRLINSPETIEICMDKFQTQQIVNKLYNDGELGICRLIKSKIISDMKTLKYFFVSNNSDIILKPIFGSKGQGIFRLRFGNEYENNIKIIEKHFSHKGSYLCQEYIKDADSDIRILIYNNKVITAMNRVQDSENEWKLNIHQGSIPSKLNYDIKIKEKLFDDSIKIAKNIGVSLCGIDILHNNSGFYFLEANSIPGLITIKKYYEGKEKSLFHELIKLLIKKE